MKGSHVLVVALLCGLLVLRAAPAAAKVDDDEEEHDHHGHAHDDHHGHAHDEHHGHSHEAHKPPASTGSYTPPSTPAGSVFYEPFDSNWQSRWTLISSAKYNGDFELALPKKNPGIAGDQGLHVPEKARHYAAVAKFPKSLDPAGHDLVVQYEVRLQNGLECGGAYLKLITSDTMGSLDSFSNETPYTIMFGPDKCGTTSKVHFIFRHQNPVSKVFEEKHLKNPPAIKTDKLTHLYTLHVQPDNTFTIYIDQESAVSGSLLNDFEPAVNPPKEIDDPEDKKPSDWVDEATIADPDATKPDDWDENAPMTIPDADAKKPEGWLDNEPAQVPDPTARKPDDWDDEEDGEWVPPVVANPKCEEIGCGEWKRPNKANPSYKGKWTAPRISNPKYKGPWAPRKIPNPNYYVDNEPAKFRPMSAVGIEIWTMSDGILFDNILIGTDKRAADRFAGETWSVKHNTEKANDDEPAPASSLTDDSPMGKVKSYIENVRRQLQEPKMMALAIAVFVAPLIILFLWPSKRAAPAAGAAASAAAPDAAPAAAAAAAAEAKEEEDEKEEPKNKPKRRGKSKPEQ